MCLTFFFANCISQCLQTDKVKDMWIQELNKVMPLLGEKDLSTERQSTVAHTNMDPVSERHDEML